MGGPIVGAGEGGGGEGATVTATGAAGDPPVGPVVVGVVVVGVVRPGRGRPAVHGALAAVAAAAVHGGRCFPFLSCPALPGRMAPARISLVSHTEGGRLLFQPPKGNKIINNVFDVKQTKKRRINPSKLKSPSPVSAAAGLVGLAWPGLAWPGLAWPILCRMRNMDTS